MSDYGLMEFLPRFTPKENQASLPRNARRWNDIAGDSVKEETFDTQLVAMAQSTTNDPTQHVRAILVAWRDAVRDQKGG